MVIDSVWDSFLDELDEDFGKYDAPPNFNKIYQDNFLDLLID